MLWAAVIAGFSLGILSSLHCVGMCGPLSLALPIHHLSRIKQILSLLIYQLGRVVTYSVMGLIFGLVGRRVYVAGFQQWFSIIMGIVVIVLVVLYWVYKNPLQPSFLAKLYRHVQQYMMKAFRSRKNAVGFLLLGMANGLLPCAMVYVAIAGALTSTEVSYSVVFMAMFGAGTLPAMMAVGYFGRMISLPLRNMFSNAVPVFITIMAIVLILRGLNLGIPFISPILLGPGGDAVSCHPS